MIIEIILFVLIALISYLLSQKLIDKFSYKKIKDYILEKNEKYYESMIKEYEKSKKIKTSSNKNILKIIGLQIEKAGLSEVVLINPITIMLISLLVWLLAYTAVFAFFKQINLSIIISLPTVLLPIAIINFIANVKQEKIEKVLLNFLLQLKNSTQINNDIVSAFRDVSTIEPLQTYIKKLLIEINSGIRFEDAIENLKSKINIKRFNMILTNFQYCYINGGSFSELISKSYEIISKIQKEKDARAQETKGARLVLIVLVIFDLFIYFTSIKNDYNNYIIMTKSVLGNAILYWNFISMWLLILLSYKVKKLDY